MTIQNEVKNLATASGEKTAQSSGRGQSSGAGHDDLSNILDARVSLAGLSMHTSPREKVLRNTDPVYDIINDLRTEFRDFVSINLRGKSGYGFGSKSAEPAELAPLVESVWSAVDAFDRIYDLLGDGSIGSLNYRAVVVNTNAHLKDFLLAMESYDYEGGLNSSDKPGVVGACISMEQVMAAQLQELDVMKAGSAAQPQPKRRRAA